MTLVDEVAGLLTSRGMTIAVAEADTCGLIGYLLGSVPGASRYFPGGVIAYANSVKRGVLGVSSEAAAQGSVSAEMALAMAEGVRRLLDTDLGVSDTGIAGPTGGTSEKPVGLFYVAISARDGYQEVQEHRWSGNRDENKRNAAEAALDLTLRHLKPSR